MGCRIVVTEDVDGPVWRAYRSPKLANKNGDRAWSFDFDPDGDMEFPSLEAELEELYLLGGETDFDAWREEKDAEYERAVREHFEPWHHYDV